MTSTTPSVHPSHSRVLVGDLDVPVTRVALTNGETFDRYTTAGPGSDPGQGLPALREGWIADRADTGTYEGRRVQLVDNGRYFEMKPKWAKNMVTALARIDGWPIGIVANNPMYFGGILDVNSADKAARFINLCDAFNIPLLFLQDVPGFMVGSKVEQQGIIRHGAKMLYATSTATVPKFTVLLRKAYGAGYYVMNGRAYEPDLFVAWPGAEVSVMGAEGMVSIAAAKVLAASENPKETQKVLADSIRPHINIYRVAALGMIDDVIDPRDTRPLLARALKLTQNKKVERPSRRREVSPV